MHTDIYSHVHVSGTFNLINIKFPNNMLFMLSSKDRVEIVFKGKIPDAVPIAEQEIASNVASEILGRKAMTGGGGIGWWEIAEKLYLKQRDLLVEKVSRDLLELHEKIEFDVIRPPLIGVDGPTRRIDTYTFKYEDKETGTWSIQRYNPISKEYMCIDSSFRRGGWQAVVDYIEKFIDTDMDVDEVSFDTFDRIVDAVGEKMSIAGSHSIGIPIETSWLAALYRNTSLIEAYLDRCLKESLERLRLYAKHGADFIFGGGDLATKNGPVYPPKIFDEIVLPRFKKIINLAHELGLPYIFRTDGNIWPIANSLLISSGTDGFGEIDASAGMKLSELKKSFPRLVLWGNVDCARTLVFGSEEDVKAETVKCISEGAPNGHYIFGSSNTIHPNVKAKNFLTMFEKAKKIRKYPINPQSF